MSSVNAYKANQRDLNIWVGELHDRPQGNYLAVNLNAEIKFQNFIIEGVLQPKYSNLFDLPYKH
jgi:hypothetical protein